MQNKITKLIVLLSIILFGSCNQQIVEIPKSVVPILKTNNSELDTIAHTLNIAIGDIVTAIRPCSKGLLKEEKPTIFAGIDYYGPWTRDASVNVMNGCGLLFPDVAKNTLIAQLQNDEDGLRIGGQYWDSPLWTIGSWQYYLYTGDKEFLKTVLEASLNQLKYLESTEYDEERGLFRGASFFNDGVSGYPKMYSNTGIYEGGEWVSDIMKWAHHNPELRHPKGEGLPMMALSTNCIYYRAYALLDSIANVLGKDISSFKGVEKAGKLKKAINDNFWNEEKGTYIYLVDPNGNCEYQEGGGLSMAVLWDVADADKARRIFETTHIEPAGLPTIYPSFPRYVDADKKHYGRHSGTIWTQINGFWTMAAKKYRNTEIFYNDFNNIGGFAFRDRQFREMFHPVTGMPYGGIQENNDTSWVEWKSTERQVWGAASYVSMVLRGMIGMQFTSLGINFNPLLDKEYENLRLLGLNYREMVLDIYITGEGDSVESFSVNDKERQNAFLSCEDKGYKKIEIHLSN
jgi:glycogen debranching enzyme